MADRLNYTFRTLPASEPGRRHKLRPGDGVTWETKDINGTTYIQCGYVVGWEMKDRGYYRVIRMTGKHYGATPYGRPLWILSYKLKATGNWWHGLLLQYRANQRLVERGCGCNCCVHEAIPRSVLGWDGMYKEAEDD